MVGVKGRSGKVKDAAHHSAKREAGRLAGLAKRNNQREPSESDPETPIPPTAGARFPVKNWIDYKDYLACELQKEKIAAAKIEVETATTKRDIERGDLLTRDQVRTRDESHAAAFKQGLQSVNELLRDHVPADKLLDAQNAARLWIERILNQVADAVEGK